MPEPLLLLEQDIIIPMDPILVTHGYINGSGVLGHNSVQISMGKVTTTILVIVYR
jgi:uncharacterized membrane protein